jgi:hypothetical protein
MSTDPQVRAGVSTPAPALLVATEAPAAPLVEQLLAARSSDDLVVVAPVLLDRLHFWTTDDRRAREEAESRLRAWIDTLAAAGVDVRGFIGGGEPLQVVEDALALVASERVFLTGSMSDHWQVRDLSRRVHETVSVPVAELQLLRDHDGLIDAA